MTSSLVVEFGANAFIPKSLSGAIRLFVLSSQGRLTTVFSYRSTPLHSTGAEGRLHVSPSAAMMKAQEDVTAQEATWGRANSLTRQQKST